MGNTHSDNRGHGARKTTTKVRECFNSHSSLRDGADSIHAYEVSKSCGVRGQPLHKTSRLPRITKASSQHHEAGPLRHLSGDNPTAGNVPLEVSDESSATGSWSCTAHTTAAFSCHEIPSKSAPSTQSGRQQRNSNRSCRVINNQLYDPFSRTYESISAEGYDPGLTTPIREPHIASSPDYNGYPDLIPSPLNTVRNSISSPLPFPGLSEQYNALVASEEIRTGIGEFLAEYYGDREPGYHQEGDTLQQTPVLDTYIDSNDGSLDLLHRGVRTSLPISRDVPAPPGEG